MKRKKYVSNCLTMLLFLLLGMIHTSNADTTANAEEGIENGAPTITITNPQANLYAGGRDGYSSVTITGKVSDPDGDPVTVTATIGGEPRSVLVESTPTSPPESDNFTITWDVYDAPLRPNEGVNKEIAFIATDGNGGEAQAIYTGIIQFDVTLPSQPTIQFTSPSGYTSGKQTDQAVTFIIEGGTDEGSDVKGYAYRFHSGDFQWGEWINYEGPVTISSLGWKQIQAVTRDRAENLSDGVNATIYINHFTNFSYPNAHDQIVSDREGNRTITIAAKVWDIDGDPFTGFIGFDDDNFQQFKIERVEPPSNEEPATENVTLTWDVVDNNLSEGVYSNLPVYTFFHQVVVGAHYPAKIIIDKTAPTAPTVQFTSPGGYTSGNQTTQPVSFRINDGTDATSGVSKSQYRIKQGSGEWGAWADYVAPVTISDVGTNWIEAKTLDKAGYESNVTSAQVVIANSPPPPPPSNPVTPVTGVSLSQNNLSFKIGDQSLRLQATITPSSATNPQVRWSSSNSAVATVNQNGEVKPVAAGQSTITVTTMDGNYTASCTVKVANKEAKLIGLKVSESHIRLKPKELANFFVYAVYEDGQEKEITQDRKTKYTTSASSIATVKTGTIHAGKKEGEAIIRVNYKEQTATIAVTVSKVEVKELILSLNKLTLEVDETKELGALAKLSNKSTIEVTQEAKWSSDDPEVLTVDRGKLQAVAPGKATVTVSYGGKTAKLNVDVKEAKKVKRLSVNKRTVKLAAGKTQELKLTAYYQDNTKSIVTDKAEWQTSDEQIAIVEDGVITAVASGTATIQAKYREKTMIITVIVLNK